MEYLVIKNNITDIECDAVINSANQHLIKGSGICKSIYESAGEAELDNALMVLLKVNVLQHQDLICRQNIFFMFSLPSII